MRLKPLLWASMISLLLRSVPKLSKSTPERWAKASTSSAASGGRPSSAAAAAAAKRACMAANIIPCYTCNPEGAVTTQRCRENRGYRSGNPQIRCLCCQPTVCGPVARIQRVLNHCITSPICFVLILFVVVCIHCASGVSTLTARIGRHYRNRELPPLKAPTPKQHGSLCLGLCQHFIASRATSRSSILCDHTSQYSHPHCLLSPIG